MGNKDYTFLEQQRAIIQQKTSNLRNCTPEKKAEIFNMQTTVFDMSNFGIDLIIDLNNLPEENIISIENLDTNQDGIIDEKRYNYQDFGENSKNIISLTASVDENETPVNFYSISINNFDVDGNQTNTIVSDQNRDGILDWSKTSIKTKKDDAKVEIEYMLFNNEEYNTYSTCDILYQDKEIEKNIKETDHGSDGLIDISYEEKTEFDENNNKIFTKTTFAQEENFKNISKSEFHCDENGNIILEAQSKDMNNDGIIDSSTKTEYFNDLKTKETIIKDEDFDGKNEINLEIFFDENGEIIDAKSEHPFEIDSKIENIKQGMIGDCWLLSGLVAFSNTPYGSEIIKNSITSNDDGSYSVYFKGIDKSFTITQNELIIAKSTDEYLKGDYDALLMELAFEKVFKEGTAIETGYDHLNSDIWNLNSEKNNETNVLDGGYFSYVTYLLTGKDTTTIARNDIHSIDPKTIPATICFSRDFMPDINGQEIEVSDNGSRHAWILKSIDEDVATIVNPWDTSKEEKVFVDDLASHISGFDILDIRPQKAESKSKLSNFFKNFENVISNCFKSIFNLLFA